MIEAKIFQAGNRSSLRGQEHCRYPRLPRGITGEELSRRTFQQATDALVQFRFNEELVDIVETTQVEKDETLKEVTTSKATYLCRKVIIACGLLHFPRKLPVLEALQSKRVYYKVPNIRDYEGAKVVVVGGGDSALDAAIMAIERHADVTVLVREETPLGKSDSVARIRDQGGQVMTSTEITAAEFVGEHVRLTLPNLTFLDASTIIVQIGFLSAKETFKRLGVRLNEDGSIAIDPYFETSRRGIFAAGDVHGDIKLITVAWARVFSSDLRIQRNHQSVLAQRKAAARSKNRDDWREDYMGGNETAKGKVMHVVLVGVDSPV